MHLSVLGFFGLLDFWIACWSAIVSIGIFGIIRFLDCLLECNCQHWDFLDYWIFGFLLGVQLSVLGFFGLPTSHQNRYIHYLKKSFFIYKSYKSKFQPLFWIACWSAIVSIWIFWIIGFLDCLLECTCQYCFFLDHLLAIKIGISTTLKNPFLSINPSSNRFFGLPAGVQLSVLGFWGLLDFWISPWNAILCIGFFSITY